MFWGQIIKSGDNRVQMDVKAIIHLERVTLDVTSLPEGSKEPTLVYIIVDDKKYLIAALTKEQPYQIAGFDIDPLEDVYFLVTGGPGSVHLIGFDVVDDEEVSRQASTASVWTETGSEWTETDGSSYSSSSGSPVNEMRGLSLATESSPGLPPPSF